MSAGLAMVSKGSETVATVAWLGLDLFYILSMVYVTGDMLSGGHATVPLERHDENVVW